MNEEKNVQQKGYNQHLHDIAVGKIQTLNMETKATEIKGKHFCRTKDYSMNTKIFSLVKGIRHARSGEYIYGATEGSRIPRVQRKKHLQRFTRVAYHRTMNAIQVGGIFKVTFSPPSSVKPEVSPMDAKQWLAYELEEDVHGKLAYERTAQWKSVWNTKHQRRSKA